MKKKSPVLAVLLSLLAGVALLAALLLGKGTAFAAAAGMGLLYANFIENPENEADEMENEQPEN